MTRIVVVSHVPPVPARGGGQQAVVGLCAALADWGPIEMLWTERKTCGDSTIDLHGRAVQVTVVPNRWIQRQAVRWLRPAIGSADSDIASVLFSGGNRQLVAQLESTIRDGDVLLLARPWLWPAARRILRRRRALLVYDAHNVEYQLKQEGLRPSAVTRSLVARIWRLEQALVQRADLTLACTEGDAAALAALAGVPRDRLLVGTKGVWPSTRADASARVRAGRAWRRVTVFVGSDHGPNNEAARWVIETLAPACPGWRFEIAGACGPAAGVAVLPPNVRVRGPVDDLAGLLETADVALNPVDSGSGVNMKLFEYQQFGLPVLCTPFGARGFEHLGHHGLVLAERAGFAPALLALEADAERRRALSVDGVACVREHFSWPAIGRRVHDRIESLRAGKAPAP